MTVPLAPPELHTCSACGRIVHQQMMENHGEAFYVTSGHDAPCGRPCIRGGVRGDVYKAGAFHGLGCRECAEKRQEGLLDRLGIQMMDPNLK